MLLQTTIELAVTPNVKNQIAWTLYKSTDLYNYATYGLDNNGVLVNTMTLEPGKYYLNVYIYGSSNTSYEIQILEK